MREKISKKEVHSKNSAEVDIPGKPKIIVIVGPNASGKSALAVQIAQKINGEIISADSRQIYKELNIATGKISKKEMTGVPHHLLDITNPKKQFTVVDFKKLAEKIIQNIIPPTKNPDSGWRHRLLD